VIFHRRDGDVDEVWLEPRPGDGRTIQGFASTARLNRNGDAFDPMGLESPRLPVPIFVDHQTDEDLVGEVTFLQRSPAGIFIRGAILRTRPGNEAWRRIEFGELHSFSTGSEFPKFAVTKDNRGAVLLNHPKKVATRVSEWSLIEVSLTDSPANADCRLKIYRPTLWL
jgi:phage head maturation protease